MRKVFRSIFETFDCKFETRFNKVIIREFYQLVTFLKMPYIKIFLDLIHQYATLLFGAFLIIYQRKRVTFFIFRDGNLGVAFRCALNYCAVVRGDQST